MYAPAYISSPRVKFVYLAAMFTAVLVCSGPCDFFPCVIPSDTLGEFGAVYWKVQKHLKHSNYKPEFIFPIPNLFFQCLMLKYGPFSTHTSKARIRDPL